MRLPRWWPWAALGVGVGIAAIVAHEAGASTSPSGTKQPKENEPPVGGGEGARAAFACGVATGCDLYDAPSPDARVVAHLPAGNPGVPTITIVEDFGAYKRIHYQGSAGTYWIRAEDLMPAVHVGG